MGTPSISTSDPWDVMVDDLGLEEYYPEKLTLQKVRSLHPKIEALRPNYAHELSPLQEAKHIYSTKNKKVW